jgi:hypothetical protein
MINRKREIIKIDARIDIKWEIKRIGEVIWGELS